MAAKRITPDIEKQPAERKDYAHDFTELLDAGETIELVKATTRRLDNGSNSTATLLGDGLTPDADGSEVVFWLRKGTPAGRHKITIVVRTSLGRAHETDQYISISEV
jgi:hypothetical protein